MRHPSNKPKLFALALLLIFLGSSLPVLAVSKTPFEGVSSLKAGHSKRIKANNNPVMFVDSTGLKPVLGPKAKKLGKTFTDAFATGLAQARRRWALFGTEPFMAAGNNGQAIECQLPFNYEDYLNGDDDITFEVADPWYWNRKGYRDKAMIADEDGVTIWINPAQLLSDPDDLAYDLGGKIIHEPTHSFLFREDPNYIQNNNDNAHPFLEFEFGVDAIPYDSSWK